jgi:hypothetical protein
VHDEGHDHDGRLHDLPELRRLEVRLSPSAAALALAALLAGPAANAEPRSTASPPPIADDSAAPAASATPVPRRARSVDLDAPIDTGESAGFREELERRIEHRAGQAQEGVIEPVGSIDSASALSANPPFGMLGSVVQSGTAARLAWQPGESFEGIAAPTPVLVVHGVSSGPVLCLTAAVHGDELNGIEIVRRVLYDLDPLKLSGTVIGVPIVNLQGFKRGSRYLPDRRDLNRYFPGNPTGSSASRIAWSFFEQVVRRCTVLVDLHTGSFYRTNLPQLRADLTRQDVVDVAASFTSTAVIHSPGANGSLRREAVAAGIPAVTLEAGEPLRLQPEEVDHGVQGIFALIDQLGMYRKLRVWGNPAPVHYRSRWVRADSGGILFGKVKLGQRVARGDLLGSVTDPITNVRADILSPWNGRVIGMAVDQVVLPGFAAFHIGIETTAGELSQPGNGSEHDDGVPEAPDSSEDS